MPAIIRSKTNEPSGAVASHRTEQLFRAKNHRLLKDMSHENARFCQFDSFFSGLA